ncbi:DNA helicase [Tanacetum coccineum]
MGIKNLQSVHVAIPMAFATNKHATTDVQKRKVAQPLLNARAEETSLSRNIRRRLTLSSSTTQFANENCSHLYISSLMPSYAVSEEGHHPCFLQLYLYDTHDEVSNIMRHFSGLNEDGLNPEIFEGGIVFEDGSRSRTDFDVIIEFRGGHPQIINKLHQSYMSLQFPLLFVFGELGFYPDLTLKPRNGKGRGKKVTMNAYYKYQLHPRVKEFGLIFRGGRLFQQYVVAVFCAIELSRLDFIRKKQNDLRSDYLSGLYDAISKGDREGIVAGSKIMLPNTFTGGPCYCVTKKDANHLLRYELSNDQIQPTYRDACEALGLLGDDKEWDTTLEDSAASASLKEIITLFAQILIYCDVTNLNKLWLKHWEAISHDIPAKISKATGIPNYFVNTPELQGYILYELETILNGFGKSVMKFGLQLLPKHLLKDLKNKLLIEEKNYKPFSNWLLDVGNDEIGDPDEEDVHNSSWITILSDYLVSGDERGLSELIDFIYDDTTLRVPTTGSLQEKAIVCPKNATADAVNAKILSDIQGESRTYLSNDQAIPMGRETSETELLYPMEYLNTITFFGFPPHELELKVGSPFMLLRNVNLSGSLPNGTRMIVKSLMSKLIEAQIITGTRIGEKVQPAKMSETTIAALKIGQENCILKAKNNAVQVTMDINNIDYFDSLLKLRVAYRFSNFICEKTKAYQQTLANEISLKFKKITKFKTLTWKESEFPEHHFEFIAYN